MKSWRQILKDSLSKFRVKTKKKIDTTQLIFLTDGEGPIKSPPDTIYDLESKKVLDSNGNFLRKL